MCLTYFVLWCARSLDGSLAVDHDVCIEVYYKGRVCPMHATAAHALRSRLDSPDRCAACVLACVCAQTIFAFWFNTRFVSAMSVALPNVFRLVLGKNELDKGKRLPALPLL
jgi:hypothetical protein